MRKMNLRATAAASVVLCAGLTVCAPAEAQLTVLHQFTGGADGGTPYAAPISDAAGNLYGTTFSGGANGFGAAYEISPPAAGGTDWNETVLYSFAGGLDGAGPNGSLVFDKAGNLYGMTGAGTTANKMIYDGSVFELIPPPGRKNRMATQDSATIH